MKKFLAEKWFVLAVTLIIAVLLINTLAVFRNIYIINKNNDLRNQIETVKSLTSQIIFGTIHGIDLGVRGYALTLDDKLLEPYTNVTKSNPEIFNTIEQLLKEQQYKDLSKFYALRKEVDAYFAYTAQMIEMARENRTDEFVSMLKQDKGYDVWVMYDAFATALFAFEDKLNQEAVERYEAAMLNNLILQVGIVLLAVPVLLFIIIRIQTERKGREQLLFEIAENDRKY